MSIARKTLIFSIIGSAIFILLTSILVASVSYNIADGFLEEQSKDRLVSIRDLQKSQLTQYLDTIEKQIITFSNNEMISTSADHLTRTFRAFEKSVRKAELNPDDMRAELSSFYQDEFGKVYREQNQYSELNPVDDLLGTISDQAVYAQYFLIHKNPHPTGQKDELNAIELRSAYGQTHKRFHPFIRKYLREFGYYDIFIIDPTSGHIVYSTAKEIDFGTSLLTGPFSNSGLAEVFNMAKNATEADFVAFSPFKAYTPSFEKPASFMASPIVNVTGKVSAVLAFQLPIDKVNRVLTYENKWREYGLGESGETYLVGEDFMLQSQDRLLQQQPEAYFDIVRAAGMSEQAIDDIKAKQTSVGLQEIRTLASEAALEGMVGFSQLQNYRGREVLSAYTPVDFGGNRFALLAEMEEAEAFAYRDKMISSVFISVLVIALIILSAVGVLVWKGTQIFSKLLFQAVDIADTVAQGKKAEITEAGRADEIGSLMRALERMQSELIAGYEEREVKTTRITNALSVANTNMMVADKNHDIVYANTSLYRMFEEGIEDWQENFPSVSFLDLVGSNLSALSQIPGLTRSALESDDTHQIHQAQIGRRAIQIVTNAVTDESGTRIGTVIEFTDRTAELSALQEERAMANENARIREALENVKSSVVVANSEHEIIYFNKSAVSVLSFAEEEIQQSLAGFSVDSLKGKLIETLHPEQDVQRQNVETLSDSQKFTLELGGRTFEFDMSPVISAENERLGTVLEFSDQTIEKMIEMEVDSLVASAAEGDLSRRIELSGKEGFIERLSIGLNKLFDINGAFVKDVGELFNNMAQGDLSCAITTDYMGQFEQIKNNANESISKLNDVMKRITATSEAVSGAASEVSEGGQKLTSSTQLQASSLDHTANNMDKINAAVKENSQSTSEANQLANQAANKAQHGGEVVQEAVDAMKEILDASHRINDIIGVIDEIAFQTNLLALNAAVEAARAGEQGRGFAVVAGEVRNLSQRSAAAAKEIKDLIRDSVSKVSVGSELVNQSGETLAEIVEAVQKVAGIIDHVNESATEQSQGIGQINHEVSQMDNMTQQNASLVNDVSSASNVMIEHSNTMKELVRFLEPNDYYPVIPV